MFLKRWGESSEFRSSNLQRHEDHKGHTKIERGGFYKKKNRREKSYIYIYIFTGWIRNQNYNSRIKCLSRWHIHILFEREHTKLVHLVLEVWLLVESVVLVPLLLPPVLWLRHEELWLSISKLFRSVNSELLEHWVDLKIERFPGTHLFFDQNTSKFTRRHGIRHSRKWWLIFFALPALIFTLSKRDRRGCLMNSLAWQCMRRWCHGSSGFRTWSW